jgi:hypothetical protein
MVHPRFLPQLTRSFSQAAQSTIPHISEQLLRAISPVAVISPPLDGPTAPHLLRKGGGVHFTENPLDPKNREYLGDVCTVLSYYPLAVVMSSAQTGNDIPYLVTLLKEIRSPVQMLGLRGNGIQSATAPDIAGLITHFPTLSYLDLSLNALGDEGINDIAPVLRHSSKLYEISLENTEFGQNGALALAEALAPMLNLVKLRIGGNFLTQTSTADVMVEAILSNKSRISPITIEGLGEKQQQFLNEELAKRARNDIEEHPQGFGKRLGAALESPHFYIGHFVKREEETLRALQELDAKKGLHLSNAVLRCQQDGDVEALRRAVSPQATPSQAVLQEQAASLARIGF